MGMTITCFRSGEKQDMASFYKWFSIGCTSRENQDITSSYKQVRMAVTKSPVNKILEASWLLHTFTSLCGLHVQCLFAQESHPCLFPTQISPIIIAKISMPCLFLFEHWCSGREFPFWKGILQVFSVEEQFGMRFGMRNPSFQYQGISAQSQFIKPGKSGHYANFRNKSLEVSWLQGIFNSMYRHQPQCVLVQESNPCLFPNQNSPTMAGNKQMCCLFLSEVWLIARICNHSKITPNVSSFMENYEVA